jgi:uncharacterized membrane protein
MPFRPQTRQLVVWSLAITLVAITTMIVRIPNSVNGYVNFGDSMIFALAMLGGPGLGAIAGGIGSALADILGGYAHYALPTLLIKGAEGFLAGYLVRLARHSLPGKVAGLAVAAVWMAGGYFFTAWLFYGLAPAWASLPGDIFQGALSIPLSLILLQLLKPAAKGIFTNTNRRG